MTRVRLVVLGLLAVSAMMAVAASAAYAENPVFTEPCSKIAGTKSAVCIVENEKSKELETGEIPISVETDTSATLSVTGGPTIVCTVTKGSGTIAAKNSKIELIDATIEYTGCEVTNTTETKEDCEVKEPITANVTGTSPKYELIDFKPKTGTVFVEVTIKSKKGKTCSFPGTSKVEGEQSCTLLSPDTIAVQHLLSCLPAGSKLTFASKAATYESSVWVVLAGGQAGKKWAVLELGS